ncbi:hypothetical protein [Clostridium sp. ZS2-4]|uniref:hypothetical protein n=1 Tax=Clostridium sp. ZS2-4 TaxID=2987703 RepID=UPI00227AB008|nr:hypothetical protein [Clostridium sp. ZS2-4]MCY6355664.1 hypothetical protein [Clostridium sp. ZS2-4]
MKKKITLFIKRLIFTIIAVSFIGFFFIIRMPKSICFFAPNEIELNLPYKGEYMVYQEYESDFGGKDTPYIYPEVNLKELEFKIFDQSMKEIELKEYRYAYLYKNKFSSYAKSIFKFKIDQSGIYKFKVDYNSKIVIAIVNESLPRLGNTVFFLTLAIMLIICFILSKFQNEEEL